MYTAVRLTHRQTNRVHHTDTQCAALEAVAKRQDRVGRLSSLAKEHADVVPEDRGLTAQEVGRKLDADEDLRELFEYCARRKMGIERHTSGNEHDSSADPDDREIHTKAANVKVDTPTDSDHNVLGRHCRCRCRCRRHRKDTSMMVRRKEGKAVQYGNRIPFLASGP